MHSMSITHTSITHTSPSWTSITHTSMDLSLMSCLHRRSTVQVRARPPWKSFCRCQVWCERSRGAVEHSHAKGEEGGWRGGGGYFREEYHPLGVLRPSCLYHVRPRVFNAQLFERRVQHCACSSGLQHLREVGVHAGYTVQLGALPGPSPRATGSPRSA